MVPSSFHLLYSSPIFIFFVLTEIVNSLPMLFLFAPSNGVFCPGRVTFTCRGIEVPSLTWAINDSDFAIFSDYNPMEPLPLNLTLINPSHLTSGVQVQVDSVNPDENDLFYNVSSTLSGDASLLRGSIIECRRLPFKSNTISIANVRDSPVSPSYTNCSDLSGGMICLRWPPAFNSLHAVELYHVVVSPTPSSCLSDQQVRPSENYTCSGLVPGVCYTFMISAINCGNQEGGRSTFRTSVVHRSPITSITAIYDENSILSEIEVKWNSSILEDIINDPCLDGALINYTLVIITEDSSGGRLDIPVEPNNCNAAMLCSTSFLLPSQQVNFYNIHFNINNDTQILQSFSYQHTLSGFSYQALNYSISFISDRIIYVFCTSPFESIENCFIQFSLHPDYTNLSSPIRVPQSTHFLITNATVSLMDTLYYQASITNSSLKIIVRSSYVYATVKTDNTSGNVTDILITTITSEIPKSGDFVTLKSYQLGLLVAVLLGLATVFLIIIIVLLCKVGRSKKYTPENQLPLQKDLDQDTPNITKVEKCVIDSDSAMYEEINQSRPTRNVNEDFELTSNYAYQESKLKSSN